MDPSIKLCNSSSIHDLILKVTFNVISLKLDLIPAQEAVSKHGQILDWGIQQKGILCPLNNTETSTLKMLLRKTSNITVSDLCFKEKKV